MSVYLVTGGAGFIGSNIAKALIEKGETVKIFDNFLTGRQENLEEIKNSAEIITGDIKDLEKLRSSFKKVDFVLHQAALCSVPRSINDPVSTNANNVDGTLNVLLASRDNNVKRVVFASSSSVYGDTKIMPKTEDLPLNPASPYAVSKLAAEHYCRVFYRNFGLETVILRYFNVFGPNQNPDSEYAAVIPRFVRTIIKEQNPIIYGDGTQTRDFTNILNVVQANLRACASEENVAGESFNVAFGNQITVNELFEKIRKLLNSDIKPLYNEMRKGEVIHSLADISKARKFLGYDPMVDLDKGLSLTVEYYKKHIK